MEISPSYLKIIVFVFLLVFIPATLRIVRFFGKRILKRQKTRFLWNKYFGVFELTVWLFFGLLSIEYFSVNNRIFAIILSVLFTIILLLIVYYYFKEILIKIFFDLTSDIKVGDAVNNKEFAGKIVQIEPNQLVIELADGNQIGIPYSRIILNPLIKQSPSPYLHRFECILTAPADTDRNVIRQQLISLMLSDIRVSGALEPKVTFSDLNELNYRIKVIAFLFNAADTESLRESLKAIIPE